MKRTSILTFSALTLLLGACDWTGIRGNGRVVTEQRSIGAFTEIKASGAFEIEWRSGPPSLTLTADENLLPYIENQISGNTLRLRTRERVSTAHRMKAVLTSPSLNGLDFSGAIRMNAAELAGPKFYMRSSGASRITLSGKVDELLGDMTGATRLEADALPTKTVEISTSGAARANVSASETLRVAISGAGKVIYSGNPKTIEKHISGAGSIRPKE